jgi:hypothetical protein
MNNARVYKTCEYDCVKAFKGQFCEMELSRDMSQGHKI